MAGMARSGPTAAPAQSWPRHPAQTQLGLPRSKCQPPGHLSPRPALWDPPETEPPRANCVHPARCTVSAAPTPTPSLAPQERPEQVLPAQPCGAGVCKHPLSTGLRCPPHSVSTWQRYRQVWENRSEVAPPSNLTRVLLQPWPGSQRGCDRSSKASLRDDRSSQNLRSIPAFPKANRKQREDLFLPGLWLSCCGLTGTNRTQAAAAPSSVVRCRSLSCCPAWRERGPLHPRGRAAHGRDRPHTPSHGPGIARLHPHRPPGVLEGLPPAHAPAPRPAPPAEPPGTHGHCPTTAPLGLVLRLCPHAHIPTCLASAPPSPCHAHLG